VDLAGEGYDAGIRIGDLLEKDMIAARIGKPLRTAILASPGYLAKHGAPKRIADLAKHACIAYRFAATRVVAEWDLLDNGREITFTPDPRITTNTVQLAIHAASEGLGLVHAIEALAAEPLREGRLVKVLPAHCQTFDAFHIYYSSRRLMPPKLRAFVDIATKRLRT
jgi:DNA-binding transcriptional LysR family regulator